MKGHKISQSLEYVDITDIVLTIIIICSLNTVINDIHDWHPDTLDCYLRSLSYILGCLTY